MREPLVGVQIQLQKQLRVDGGPAADDRLKVARQIGPFERPGDVARQRLERGRLIATDVPARQPMVPGAIRKLLDGEAIDLLDFCREGVLLEELGGRRVQARGRPDCARSRAGRRPGRREAAGARPDARYSDRARARIPATGRPRAAAARRPRSAAVPCAERHPIGPDRQLLEQPVVRGEFLRHLLLPGERVGHRQRDGGPLGRVGERRQEPASAIDHRVRRAVRRIRGDERGVQTGAPR